MLIYNYKTVLFLIFALFLQSACSGTGSQSFVSGTAPMPASSASRINKQLNHLEILLLTDAESENIRRFTQDNSVQLIGFVNDAQFMRQDRLFSIDRAGLDAELQRAYPDKNAVGTAYIDLEAPYLDWLMHADVNSAEFKKSKQLFLDVLSYVKRERPNVKWGYYAIPFTDYWNRKPSFYAGNNRIAEIIRASDVLFPSIYIFYNYLSFKRENESYIRDNTRESIKTALKYGKPVYPMVMTRYHPSNAKVGDKSIAFDDFDFYVKTIAAETVAGKRVDGIALWNADGYFYRTKLEAVRSDVERSGLPFQRFYDAYLETYLKILLKYK